MFPDSPNVPETRSKLEVKSFSFSSGWCSMSIFLLPLLLLPRRLRLSSLPGYRRCFYDIHGNRTAFWTGGPTRTIFSATCCDASASRRRRHRLHRIASPGSPWSTIFPLTSRRRIRSAGVHRIRCTHASWLPRPKMLPGHLRCSPR